jgi:SAM-dependent methyltransferase
VTTADAVTREEKEREGYERHYQAANYFNYRPWLYRPYVRALARKAGLRHGARILDAGCGQGFFSSLFSELGLEVVGVDLSEAGVRAAQRDFNSPRVSFSVGDCLALPFHEEFDCVFSRSCSLFNTAALEECRTVSDALLRYLRPGGTMIFDYYSRLTGEEKDSHWRHHCLADVSRLFSPHPNAEVYFASRLDTMVLGQFAFSAPMTSANRALSRLSGVGGEIVAFVRKSAGAA